MLVNGVEQGDANANVQDGGSAAAAGSSSAQAGAEGASAATGAEGAAAGGQADSNAFQVEQFINSDWKNHIPEDLKERAEFARVNSLTDVFKNYVEGQQTISKSVRLPDATSTAEEVNAFYAKLGKPASKDEYDFEYKPENENYKLNKDCFDFNVFKDVAEAGNLTKAQYEALASKYLDIQNDNVLNYNKQLETQAINELKTSEATLREAWGTKYAENINQISAKVTKLYPQETVDRMAQAGLFRDVNFLQSHLKLTNMMRGDTVFIEGSAVENIPQSIETLSAKRDELMASNYAGNKVQVNELNMQITKLKMAQSGQIGKFQG